MGLPTLRKPTPAIRSSAQSGPSVSHAKPQRRKPWIATPTPRLHARVSETGPAQILPYLTPRLNPSILSLMPLSTR